MTIKLRDLIDRIPADVEEKVRRVRDQVQPAVREALRAECRLIFRTPEESAQNRQGAQVPVEVAPGYPAVLKNVQFPDDLQRVMLLGRFRTSLEGARRSAPELLTLRDALSRLPDPEKWTSAAVSELRSVEAWAAELLKELEQNDPLKKVLAVHEDFLGVYEYEAGAQFVHEFAINRATIRLYWGVIGLISAWLGCTVEDLTIVVLTHELAHAYTQLGADIDGRRWAAASFMKAETGLKEGLAQ
jgi:hypothetical protein